MVFVVSKVMGVLMILFVICLLVGVFLKDVKLVVQNYYGVVVKFFVFFFYVIQDVDVKFGLEMKLMGEGMCVVYDVDSVLKKIYICVWN